jgi:folate-binding Fe-S cluster repair protein YgfZ
MDDSTDTVADTTLRWSAIIARGPDAESFLQGQLSQDITTVGAHGQWALLLAPDGTVITSSYVKATSDGYVVEVPRELGDAALARLRRFLLRTKCTLELSEIDHGPFNTVSEQIHAGRPGPVEFAFDLTPQCFGGSFVTSSVSFTKGCFTGQELVGRLDARGSSVPWRMVRVTGPSEARADEVLTSKGPAGPSGLTTAMRSDGSIVGLGFAHRSLLGSAELELALDVHVEEIA